MKSTPGSNDSWVSGPLRCPTLRRWCFETLEAELGIGCRVAQHQRGEDFADGWAHLEAVTGAAPGDPHAGVVRMTVDQEMRVRGAFVLADFRVDEGRTAESGESAGQILARALNPVGRRQTLV